MIRPRKKIHVFPLTYSKILGSVGRKKILFFKIFLARFYKGHILTLIVPIKNGKKKNFRVGRVSGNTCNFFFWPNELSNTFAARWNFDRNAINFTSRGYIETEHHVGKFLKIFVQIDFL